ncbi:hypothetical protein L207DRAFT_535972 [Hyaloscypha variabilis F]|uniref:Uncharacterized protein n=1 Tax=Hyaloscypha variabilis (strain UAMH 11265 / GT02V1 / F) TaxID=1149755 RepID=A0A2J6R2C5_HYAVF|nr:hypothetical protein L207DRAFT_535972 [Hyaloscypha variabilis F]
MPKVPNPMENDERWELETQKKNALFLAIRQFRAEPEFKNLNQSFEDPNSAEARELRIKNQDLKEKFEELKKKNIDLEANIDELKQHVSQERGSQRQSLQRLNEAWDERQTLEEQLRQLERRIQNQKSMICNAQEQNAELHTLNLNLQTAIDKAKKTIRLMQADIDSHKHQLQVVTRDKDEAVEANSRAEEAKAHAEANYTSLRKVWVKHEDRKAELEENVCNLEKEIGHLEKTKEYWRYEQQKTQQRVLDLNAKLQQLQLRTPSKQHQDGIPSGSPILESAREQEMESIFAQAPRRTSILEIPMPSSSGANLSTTTTLSGSSPQARNGNLTALEKRIVERMANMTEKELQDMEPAMDDRDKLLPGKNYHWVRGHFARNPGTKDDETPAELKLKEKIHAKIHESRHDSQNQ